MNELCASNSSIIADELDQYNDWVEIYNNGVEQVDLSGLYLTDDLSELTKWKFPERTILDGGQYLLVWADGSAGLTRVNTMFYGMVQVN